MKASTISTALVTTCVLALAVSSQPASAWQVERAPIQIPSDQELDDLKAAQLQREIAKAKSDLALAKLKSRLNCDALNTTDYTVAPHRKTAKSRFSTFLMTRSTNATSY